MLGFYVPPTAKVIRRRDLGLKSYPKDWRSPGSNSGPLVYKAGSLTARPRRLLYFLYTGNQSNYDNKYGIRGLSWPSQYDQKLPSLSLKHHHSACTRLYGSSEKSYCIPLLFQGCKTKFRESDYICMSGISGAGLLIGSPRTPLCGLGLLFFFYSV